MSNAALLVLLVPVIAGCGRLDAESQSQGESRSQAVAPVPHSGLIPTQAQIERFIAEGPEPALRQVAVADYWLHYKLMQATGIEQELGGEAPALQALQAMGDAYERHMRRAEVELPKMVPAAFTGEGMSSGFVGMGMGTFAGMLTGGGLNSAVSRMSDAQLRELSASGPIKSASDGGSLEMSFSPDGSMSQSLEFEVNQKGLNGKVRMKLKMEACPDSDGRVTVDIEADSQMSVSGKPGTGGRVQTQFRYERFLDDDAHLISDADGSASNLRVRMGGYENFESQSLDLTLGHERGGRAIFEHHDEQGFSIFNPEEVDRTKELLSATQALQMIMGEAMLRGMLANSGPPWESGRCIDLKVASTPAKRNGLRPGSRFEIEATPRTRAEGSPAGGSVTATLTGGSKLSPGSEKVPADARYGYTAPGEKQETASIAFEARSRRGVGRATLEFDTRLGRAYRMEGGADEFHGAGTVCDLSEQFFVEGSGVTVRFEPGSDQGGRYSYSGSMSGFRVHGHGTYVVNYEGDVAVGIIATGPGSVDTPMGTVTDEGTENYRLTPLTEGCTAGS